MNAQKQEVDKVCARCRFKVNFLLSTRALGHSSGHNDPGTLHRFYRTCCKSLLRSSSQIELVTQVGCGSLCSEEPRSPHRQRTAKHLFEHCCFSFSGYQSELFCTIMVVQRGGNTKTPTSPHSSSSPDVMICTAIPYLSLGNEFLPSRHQKRSVQPKAAQKLLFPLFLRVGEPR